MNHQIADIFCFKQNMDRFLMLRNLTALEQKTYDIAKSNISERKAAEKLGIELTAYRSRIAAIRDKGWPV